MPIVAPVETPDSHFFERLEACGAAVIREDDATHQDIRPARIGLLNLMPASAMEGTELRWLRFMSHSVLQIEPVLVKFDNDCREVEGSKRRPILQRYVPLSYAKEIGLDALIVSGDNQELRPDGTPRPFSELHYSDRLAAAIDWADEAVPSIIYSCLASHFALNRKHGIDRTWSDKKVFGVYDHQVLARHGITNDMDDSIRAPHSRWGNMCTELLAASNLSIVADSEEVGWLIAEEPTSGGGISTYIQGHPEYWRNDLLDEFTRDQQQVPANYFSDPERSTPSLSWSNDARALFLNWIAGVYEDYSLKN
jgi:homoserine O-succinyltransferase